MSTFTCDYLSSYTPMAHLYRCFHLISLIRPLLETVWAGTDCPSLTGSLSPLLVLLSPVWAVQFTPFITLISTLSLVTSCIFHHSSAKHHLSRSLINQNYSEHLCGCARNNILNERHLLVIDYYYNSALLLLLLILLLHCYFHLGC